MFDEGCFKDNMEQAAGRVADLIEVMMNEHPSATSPAGDPLLEVFKTVWYRVAEVGWSYGGGAQCLSPYHLAIIRRSLLNTQQP